MITKYKWKTHNEWLELRRAYIGGSEAGSIIGMNYEYIIPLVPPSNNKYIGNGTKGKNFEYQTEKKHWAGYVNLFCRPKPPVPLEKAKVTLHYYFKDNRRRDPDNYSGKFILDGLVKAKIIQDDSFSVIDLELRADVDMDKQGYTVIEVAQNR